MAVAAAAAVDQAPRCRLERLLAGDVPSLAAPWVSRVAEEVAIVVEADLVFSQRNWQLLLEQLRSVLVVLAGRSKCLFLQCLSWQIAARYLSMVC